MTGKAPEPQLAPEHVYLTEPEAARLLDGHRIRRGDRVMDPKAQVVGEVIRRLRPLDALPTPDEARGQFRTTSTSALPPNAGKASSPGVDPGPAPSTAARSRSASSSTWRTPCRPATSTWAPVTKAA